MEVEAGVPEWGAEPPGPPVVDASGRVSFADEAEPPATEFEPLADRRARRGLILYAGVLIAVCALSSLLALGGYFVLGGKAPALFGGRETAAPTSAVLAGVTETATTVPAVTSTPEATSTTVMTITAAPSPTSTPTATAVATPTPQPTHTPTHTPTPTDTPVPTSTPAPTATAVPTPTPTLVSYELLIVARGDDSLFVVNQGETSLPLEWLRLSNKKGEVSGVEWKYGVLGPGDCVAVWKNHEDAKPPDKLVCENVGARIEREGSERFWKEAFDVHYGGDKVGECKKTPRECEIAFTR
jgi:hypothetical protein